MNKVGKNRFYGLVARYKVERGLNVEDIAKTIGCSVQTVYRTINSPDNSDLSRIKNIGKVLKIPRDELAEVMLRDYRV